MEPRICFDNEMWCIQKNSGGLSDIQNYISLTVCFRLLQTLNVEKTDVCVLQAQGERSSWPITKLFPSAQSTQCPSSYNGLKLAGIYL